jgi:hypothetical protein
MSKVHAESYLFQWSKTCAVNRKGTCDFVEKRLLLSWTCSPPNLRILKQKKADPYGSMTIEDGCNV